LAAQEHTTTAGNYSRTVHGLASMLSLLLFRSPIALLGGAQASSGIGKIKRPQGAVPAASVSRCRLVACYAVPPPGTKAAGPDVCGRPRLNKSIDSSTHVNRRGFHPCGAVVCLACPVMAIVNTSMAPLCNECQDRTAMSACQYKKLKKCIILRKNCWDLARIIRETACE
jgi:hypothetical protein